MRKKKKKRSGSCGDRTHDLGLIRPSLVPTELMNLLLVVPLPDTVVFESLLLAGPLQPNSQSQAPMSAVEVGVLVAVVVVTAAVAFSVGRCVGVRQCRYMEQEQEASGTAPRVVGAVHGDSHARRGGLGIG